MEKRNLCASLVGMKIEKQYGHSSKNAKIKLPYDPAITVWGIYPKKMKTLPQKDICTPMS